MIDLCQTLYKHRELISVLVAKQLKLRYRGSILGFLWTLLNPLLLMLVYTLVFSVYFRLDMEKYPAFLFSGLLPWIWFSSSLQQGVTSILDGAGLVTRSQFPAEVLPVVTVTSNAVNFLLTLLLLFPFLLAFQIRLGIGLLVLPILIGIEYLLALGRVLDPLGAEHLLPGPPAHHPPPLDGVAVPHADLLPHDRRPRVLPSMGSR